MADTDKRNLAKARIVNYIMAQQSTSKVEVSRSLGISMPTVLSNVNDLLAKGVVVELGEYESTGGRKAKSIGMNPDYRYAIGIVITANHVGIALVNLRCEIAKYDRIRLRFSPDAAYCQKVAALTQAFLAGEEAADRILGIGISIPGIIDHAGHMVVKSHALGIENYSLEFLEQALPYPVHYENDANAAMLAENLHQYPNAIYLSLNQTLGGAFCIDGELIHGRNQRAGEFGHMILVPKGRKCYCGKLGCADAYCAASVLTSGEYESIDRFMEALRAGDAAAHDQWEEYLDHLAILISNLRMAYDMDVILGGEVGGYMNDHMLALGERVMQYNGFDHDVRYLYTCSYRREASAVGVARYFLQEFVNRI